MAIIKVKTGGITADAITSTEIADNAVVTAAINADAVTDAKIADDVVGTEHLTANEVDTAALAADAVTAAQLADNAISEEHLDVTAITGHTAETSVADGDLVVIHDASATALKKMTVANLVANAGGGKINQVVQTHNTTLSQMSSSSFADVSGMSVAITPSASNSKILITVSLYAGQNGNSVAFFKLLRGSTVIGSGADAGNRVGCNFSFGVDGGDGHSQVHSNSYSYLDSPSTTSETTYKIQGASYNNATLTFNKTPNDADHVTSARCTSVITAIEVLA